MVLAAGVTLTFAGLLTSVSVSLLGVVLAGAGCAGWFREMFPAPHEIAVSAYPEDVALTTVRTEVERLPGRGERTCLAAGSHLLPSPRG
jgi:hypothetical protein